MGTVRFVDPATGNEAIGDTSFPPSCTVPTWQDESITVKVPRATTPTGVPVVLAGHNVRVVRADGRESEAVGFTVISGEPGPGVCAITPISAPTATAFSIYGEYFGSTPSSVAFYNSVVATTRYVAAHPYQGNVPSGGATGPVIVTVGATPSNEVNFEVAACDPSATNACFTGYRCCANTLACTPTTMDCAAAVPATNTLFEWVTDPSRWCRALFANATTRACPTAL